MAESRHDATGAPEIFDTLHRANKWIAIGREGEGPVDHPLDTGLGQNWKMFVSHFKIWRDTIQIWLQQFAAKLPGCLFGLPGPAILFIGAKHQSIAFLAHVDFRFEIDDVRNFLAVFLVEGNHFWHIISHQIHVFHGQHGQFNSHHAAHFTCPQSTAIHHMLGMDAALVGDHIPSVVGAMF